MKKILSVLIVAAILTSCGASKNIESTDPSFFQKWDLKILNGRDISGEYRSPVYIDFSKDDLKVNGSAACNRFFGSYAASGKSLTFSQLASTRMLCDEESDKLETEFLQTLEKVTGYRFDKKILVFLNGKEEIARFEESKAVPDELVGRWELFFITGRRIAFQGLYPDKKPFIIFQQGKSTFSSNTGCNSLTGTYNGRQSEKLFNPGAMTMMACPGEGEQVFLEQLKIVDSYQIHGDTLIFSANNISNMKFIRTSGLN